MSESNPSAPDWAWELRLFCSADLVGSTAFKAKTTPGNRPQWAATFSEFFRFFPEQVDGSYAELPEGCIACEHSLKPWKFSGDEILFSVPISDHRQGISHVCAFKQAVAAFPERSNWKSKGIPLGLKATAWIAGFPVTNRKVFVPGTDAVDYIGPSIDLGFRLTGFSTEQKFVLSAALALLISDGRDTSELPLDTLRLHLDETQPLKGVIDGAAYPIVYCDMNDGRRTHEEELLGIIREHKPDVLREYLRDFIDGTPKLIRPFIDEDDHPKYSSVPIEIARLREEMMAEETDRQYLVDGESEGPETEGAEKTPPKPSLEMPDDRGE